MIKNEKWDKKYQEKQKYKIKTLELEREESTLLLKRKKLINNEFGNGREETKLPKGIRENNSLRIS